MATPFNSGDIVLVNFVGAQGAKQRPAVVLTSDIYHSTRPDLIVGIITSKIARATGPTDYILQDWGAAGLHRPSAFRTYLLTYRQSDVIAKIGKLSERDWQAICAAVKNGLAVLEISTEVGEE